MIEAIREGCNSSLEQLYFQSNRIGNAGCHALATLLEHTNSNLQILYLRENLIGNEGATAIADSLVNNTKLKSLYLGGNPFETSAVDTFCRVLCNTSSVNDTYRSNHTLDTLDSSLADDQRLLSSLEMNNGTNKSYVAIRKILKYHHNIAMEPLFEWDEMGNKH